MAIGHLPEEQSDADELIALIEAEGRTAVALPGDIRDEAFCQRMVAQAVAALGGLDILVSNAAKQQAQASILASPPSSSTPPSGPSCTPCSGSPRRRRTRGQAPPPSS